MRGRKPKPTALRLLAGNPGRRPLNGKEAHPKAGLPPPPAHFRAKNRLAELALAEYRRAGRKFLAAGLLTEIDGPLLAAYADAFSRWVVASEGLQEYGLLIKGRKGELVKSPYSTLVNTALDQMRHIALEFGVGPSARTRIHVETIEIDDDDERFFKPRPSGAQ